MKSARLLNAYFARKKKSRPGFSMRSFARLLKVSPSFVSGLLSGKKPIPISRLQELSHALDLDEIAASHLKEALVHDQLKTRGHEDHKVEKRPSEIYTLIPKSQFSLLDPWYKIPLMDLTTCENFKKTLNGLQKSWGLVAIR